MFKKSFAKEALAAHNAYREQHGVPTLKLSDELSSHAQKWADNLARTNKFQHSGNREYGENIAMSYSSQGTEYSGQQATDQWYSEIKDYNFKRAGFTSGTGHFTQVVWKDSKELGIGKAVSRDGKVYVVANYRPPGNMTTRFDSNIFPLRGGAVAKKPTARRGSSSSSSSSDDDKKTRKFSLVKTFKDTELNTKTSKSDLAVFRKDVLSVHNGYRLKHGVGRLTLSDALCKSAQDWADHLAKKDLFEHSKRSDIGENVAMHYSSATTEYSGKEASDQWYSELGKYDFKKPGFGSGTGHFSQMVWKDSKELGVGKAITKDGKVLIVGQYRPPGNVIGHYESNVLPRSDGYRPEPTAAQTTKVTRVVRNTQYVVEDKPDHNMDLVTRKVGGIKLKEPVLSPPDLKKFERDALTAHNKYRARHGVSSLKRSEELSRRAQDWAAHLAKNDQFKNSGNDDVGENIAMHYSSASTEFSGDDVTDMWYRQVSKYDFKKSGFTSGAGHFTQMVWKDTKEMGIGKAITKEGKVLLVAFYRPPGNVMRQFEEQVLKERK